MKNEQVRDNFIIDVLDEFEFFKNDNNIELNEHEEEIIFVSLNSIFDDPSKMYIIEKHLNRRHFVTIENEFDESIGNIFRFNIIPYSGENERLTITIYSVLDMRGYCCCTEEDESYNLEKECCGIDCDWFIPVIEFEDIVVENHYFEYGGEERNYWNDAKKMREKLNEIKAKRY